MKKQTTHQLASKYADFFETKTRTSSGKSFVALKDDRPEELLKAIKEAHGDMLPHDWIYSTFLGLLNDIAHYELDTIEDLEDRRHEIVDGLVDIYTNDLTAWLASSIHFTHYIEDAVNDHDEKENVLGVAQYIAIDEIMYEVMNLLENNND